MNDHAATGGPNDAASATSAADRTLGASSIYRLCEEVIALRELNNRQHKLFEQSLNRARDALQASFNSFAADTNRAYQQLRDEIHGDRRIALALLQQLLEIGQDLDTIVSARPANDDLETLGRWADSVAVEARKVNDMLGRLGIHPFDAVAGSAYNPALHERVGTRRVEGMEPFRIAEQQQPGLASQQPEFVLVRPKVIVTE